MNTTLQIRIDNKTKEKARKAFQKSGLDMTSGMRLYLNKVANEGEIPFEMFSFNNLSDKRKKELLKDMEETLKHGKRYSSSKELLDEILNEK